MARLKVQKFNLKDGAELTLRSPERGEGAALLTTMREVIAKSEHLLTQIEEFNITVEQEESMIAKFLDEPNQILIVPEVDGRIVGMLDFRSGARSRIAHTGEFGMSLLSDYRGRGIGRLMLEALIGWAELSPIIEKLILRVHGRNEQAVRLYQRAGFEIEGREIRGVKLGDGQYDDTISMARFV